MPPLRSLATFAQVPRSAVSSACASLSRLARRTRWRWRCTSRSHAPWPVTPSRTRARPRGMSKASRSKRSSSVPRASGGVLMTVLRGGKRPSDALRDACGLLVALYLDGESSHDLPPIPADIVYRNHFCLGPHARSGRDRRREADLVPAVVHAQREALRLDQAEPQAVDQREREVAVGDRGAERALGLGALHVDVDPLVVARHVGECVDQLLGDLAPLARAHFLPDERLELVNAVRGYERHADHPTAAGRRSPPGPLQPLHLLTLRK